MIALVLAAGYGTRLRPYTDHTPKPLFMLNRQPLLDIMIRRLLAAGTRTVIVNTHHHHRQIEDFLRRQPYAPDIMVRHEPDILGTGGAIRNTADIWRSQPLLVVNSDIYTDIDFKALQRFHGRHDGPVSLALCDHPDFNSVTVRPADRVAGFRPRLQSAREPDLRLMTFTGIQMLEDDILAYIPAQGFASSIDAYQAMLDDGHAIAAYTPRPLQWSDLGTPESYREMARTIMANEAFKRVGAVGKDENTDWRLLPGDGSDRQWYRLQSGDTSLIVADHDIKPSGATCEAEAFVAIGRHLHQQDVPVPEIYLDDPFAGLVFMEDLGSQSLQDYTRAAVQTGGVEAAYRRVIDVLLTMSFEGGKHFDPGWTYQTPRYDQEVILNGECRYFVDAFLIGYLGMSTDYETLEPECRRLADTIMAVQPLGFMHRDFQSRNIMVRDDHFYLIDFQGGRIGPPHYDLAALLIDPYVDLPFALRESLLSYFAEQLEQATGIAVAETRHAFRYCALARNLQILGAYGFLTRKKNKPQFSRYIPAALNSLQQNFDHLDQNEFPRLTLIIREDIPRHQPYA